jgi:Zn-dependent protease
LNGSPADGTILIMRDPTSLSIGLGRWGGVLVRLHLFFLLFVAFTLYLSWRGRAGDQHSALEWLAAMSLAILLASVLLHEIAHIIVARRLGGHVDRIVIAPFGGIESPQGLGDPYAQVLGNLAGPAGNLVVCLMLTPVLLATSGDIAGLLHPLHPNELGVGSSVVVVSRVAFWINWILLLVNLLPVFPFDGGRAARAALILKWPQLGWGGATLIVTAVAKVGAIALVAAAFLVQLGMDPALIPTRFVVILFAIFLYFAAKHEEERVRAESVNERLSADLDDAESLEWLEDTVDHLPVDEPERETRPLQRWLEQRRRARHEKRRQIEAEEEKLVDEILARVHEHGVGSLSSDEQQLLERVSARYRERLGRP